jgi:ribosome-binding ATPase YchF (GTP1/OBG family)
VLEGLNEGHRARSLGLSAEEQAAVCDLHLLTMKPMLYLANVDEDQLFAELPLIDGVAPVALCAKVEADLAELDPDEAAEYLESLGLTESGLARLVREAYRLLGLQSYFTSGETETRAWTVPVGAKAPQAAGIIHSDFERGFIKAETVACEDYLALGGEAGCRAAGKLRQEGKDYVVQDGDVMHFKFNV